MDIAMILGSTASLSDSSDKEDKEDKKDKFSSKSFTIDQASDKIDLNSVS